MNTSYSSRLFHSPPELLCRIHSLLFKLGIGLQYKGFWLCAYAIYLSVTDPIRLSRITKNVYAEVAEYFHISLYSVERNIRTVIEIAWQHDPEGLAAIYGRKVLFKPTASEFISMITFHLIEKS